MLSGVRDQVNNNIYHLLGVRWYTAKENPVALLRAESRTRNPWIIREIRRTCPSNDVKILDVGCGAGFLANDLARAGFDVVGLDASKQSLDVAKKYDATGQVDYQLGDAHHLPFPAQSLRLFAPWIFWSMWKGPIW